MNNWQEFIEKIKPNTITEDEPLASHLTSATKTTAKLFTAIDKIENLIKVVTQARLHKIPIYIIGSGSWIQDCHSREDGNPAPSSNKNEINGLVIKNNCRKFDLFEMQGKIIVYSESGTIFNQLTRFTIEKGFKGLEYQLGLPGTVGGAIFTNARYTPKRIYVNDKVEKIKIINEQNEIQEVTSEYFTSHSSSEFSPTNAVILSAIFHLSPGDTKILWERGDEAVAYRKKKYE